MTVIGYARVSTTDQDLSIQEAALHAAGCDVIRAEKQSGTSTQGRAELRTVLDFIGKGRRAAGHACRSPGALDRRSAGHRPHAQG
jgi:DNA invertase Pin-like site-specific DNA recombinase